MRAARVGCVVLFCAVAQGAWAAPTLQEYKTFRALSVDLLGRIPTRTELVEFEAPGFNLDTWLDAHLQGPAYAERLRRIYVDLLRLEVGPVFQFVPSLTTLRRVDVLGPSGTEHVFFRLGQRRARAETDGEFCLTQAETGQQFPHFAANTGTPVAVTQAVLDANTVLVKPWWSYRDYKAASPTQYFSADWPASDDGYAPAPALLMDPDGGPAIAQVRVCKEEAQPADMGTVFVTGRITSVPAGTPPPYGRLAQLPLDSAYARAHHGEPQDCTVGTALANSADCGLSLIHI